ncbi:methyl-accepting chemotaxis protein [Pelosinus sp. sgz500959]|uniref:methyl-accepting chemotaxis protein n=1 Tax=Pelosinus sp. sgz500959 TaxID=3242472 RepID=UPI00367013EC
MSVNWKTVIFSPGAKFLQKLKFFQKILVLVTIMLIAICVQSYFLHVEMKKVTDFASQERKGVQYMVPLSEVLIELSGKVINDVSGSKIEQQIRVIEKNDANLGMELNTTPVWNELKPLLQKNISSSDGLAREAAINKTLELIAVVGDSSNLVLDPDMDSYYIMDAVNFKYPNIISKSNQLSSIAMDSLSKSQRTVDDQIKTAIVEGAIRSTFDATKIGIKKASDTNTTLTNGIQVFNESETATMDLLKVIDDNSVGKQQLIINRVKIANDKNAAAYRLYLQQLDTLLAKRINDANSHNFNIFAIVLIVLVITAYLIIAFYFSLKETIAEILTGVKFNNDLTWRVRLVSMDEIGDVARWINSLLQQLHQTISKVANETDKVNAYAGNTAETVEQQVSFSLELSSSVTEISATMEEFASSSFQISAHSQGVATIADETLERSRQGVADVEALMDKMNEINRDNQRSIQEIEALGEKSQEINKVMEIINNIANQTRLIAFNAALEAASAGEAGKRFGVVAVEIRHLADSVMESVKEIETRTNEIMKAVNRQVITSEKNAKGIQEGFDYSRRTVSIMHEIQDTAEQTTDAVHQISLSIQQQQTASEQVVEALRQIQDGTKENSEMIQQTNRVSKDLATLAEELKRLIEIFKL